MRTLVTGGTGFLGRRLVERLVSESRDVTVLARHAAPDLSARGVRFVTAPLHDTEALARACAEVETVFHVAARVGVWGPYEEFYRTNVLGTRGLLAACRTAGVRRLVYTSTPSVVYNGRDLAGADESWPLTTSCPSAYPLTKAIAEREVLGANSATLQTVALRPHLIWGVGDPHLVPRLLARARAGRLRIVGHGRNRVDMVHVENAVDAHLLAETALRNSRPPGAPSDPLGYVAPTAREPAPAVPAHPTPPADTSQVSGQSNLRGYFVAGGGSPAGRAYFITNGEPVVLWDWINGLLTALGEPPVRRRLPLGAARAIGALCEAAWASLQLKGEPPMTRFVADELAKDHWFRIDAARRDLGYVPRITMTQGTAQLVHALKTRSEFTDAIQ